MAKEVLILSASAGAGHLRAAFEIVAKVSELGETEPPPAAGRASRRLFDRPTRKKSHPRRPRSDDGC